MKRSMIGAAALFALTSAANAATYQLSYDFIGGDSFVWTFDGTSDGTVVTTNGVNGTLLFNGVSYTIESGYAGSYIYEDYSQFSVYMAETTNGHYIELSQDKNTLPVWGVSTFIASGNSFESSNNGSLSLTEVTAPTAAVPLPAGLPLALTGIAGLVALRRRAA